MCGGGTSGTLDLNLLIEVRQKAFCKVRCQNLIQARRFLSDCIIVYFKHRLCSINIMQIHLIMF